MIIISPDATISQLADLEDSVRGTKIIIKSGVHIDSFVKIKPAGGTGDVIVGRNSHINSGCVLYTGNGITIGENVLIAANCTLAPTNHAFLDREKLIKDQGFTPSRGGIIIEDDVWIGANSVILDGARIRIGAVIGACSLVNREIEPYSINFGTPLRLIGHRKNYVQENN